jgi:uncharacterized protein with PIN domain
MFGNCQETTEDRESQVFCADGMLGKLARWMRFMGFNTLYAGSTLSDLEIIAFAKGRSMVLLTSDRLLAASYDPSILICSTNLPEQIRRVVSAFRPDPSKFMTRCSVCNCIITKMESPGVNVKVPLSVTERGMEVMRCPGCGRLYWKGSHFDSIIMKINSIIGGKA